MKIKQDKKFMWFFHSFAATFVILLCIALLTVGFWVCDLRSQKAISGQNPPQKSPINFVEK